LRKNKVMFGKESIKTMLFIDIETVSSHSSLAEMEAQHPNLHHHWPAKANLIRKGKPELMDLDDAKTYEQEAALYAEFAKTVCISIGQVTFDDYDNASFKVKSFYGDDEQTIIEDFFKAITALLRRAPNLKIVGHNIKGFDLPFLLRKAVVYGVNIPRELHLHSIKPWESCLLDTSEIWKFGSWTGAPLGLLCTVLGIPTPKDAMDGSQVSEAYWKESRLEDIKTYCEKDVKATANVILKVSQLPIL